MYVICFVWFLLKQPRSIILWTFADYAFPYLSIIISMISNAVHFSMKLDQSMRSLFKTSITEMKNITIISKWPCFAAIIFVQLGTLFCAQHFSWPLVDSGVWNKFPDGQQCGVACSGSGASSFLHFHSEIHRPRRIPGSRGEEHLEDLGLN